ncbi:MAG: hypothetical protein OXE58_06275, partial [Acidobacteria bacterium]|nr:hypothetical protein [Acidobacteriota bacterium]
IEERDVKKYLVLYHMPMSFMEMAQDADPAEMKAGMEAWMAWFHRCGDQLVDMGTQLSGGRRLTSAGSSPSERNVVCYSIVQAESMEAAETLLADHPHLTWSPDCEIEVHEMAGGSG